MPMTETAYPQFARIHVSPSPDTHEWPVVERVSGGWQSGAHHYPDSVVLDYEPLHVPPDPAADIRDGLPTADEIRAAATYLQIPLDVDGMGLETMTPERQVTCLLGVMFAWIAAYQYVNDMETDPLDPDGMAMLVSSSQFEVTDGVSAANMNAALWHMQWAAFINAELGRSSFDNPSSPASALLHLLRAAGLVMTVWRDVHASGHGISIDGTAYSMGDGTMMLHGRDEAAAALASIEQLLSPERR